MSDIIKLKNVSKTFLVSTLNQGLLGIIKAIFNKENKKQIKALSNVNFEIKKGEIFGIIGSNGSGKSTLLNLIIGNYKPDKGGIVDISGKVIRLTLGMGVDPNLSGRENIYVNGSMIGLTFKEISANYKQIIDFAGLKEFENVAVKFYSKGMKNRLLFSIAVHANADIFLLDEFFGGVGDKDFKQKSDQVFQDNISKRFTIILVSHQLKLIRKHCQRVMWLEKGNVKMIGTAEDVVDAYKISISKSKLN